MLTNFKLVHTEGLKGLMLKGRLIPFEKIDDTLAETLIGKTHVLKRITAQESATTPVVLTLAEPAAEAEAPAATSRRRN